MLDEKKYTGLTEQGVEEFQKHLDQFKSGMKKVAKEVIDGLYLDLSSYIESDSWINFRNNVLDELCNYKNKYEGSYVYKRIRQAIFEEHRDEIIKDLNQDLVDEVKALKDVIKQLSRERY